MDIKNITFTPQRIGAISPSERLGITYGVIGAGGALGMVLNPKARVAGALMGGLLAWASVFAWNMSRADY